MPARTSPAPVRSLAWLPLVAAAALAPALTGCEIPVAMMIADDASNDDSGPYYYDDGYYGGDQSALQTKNARVHGDLGEAIGFSGDADYVDAWDDGYTTSLTLWADGSNDKGQWATMTALSIQGDGGIASEVFKPGAKLHFSSDDYDQSPYVYTWGCSGTGSDADMLDYEASSSETDIEVTESEEPGMVHLAVKISYPGSGSAQVVEGELDVVVPE